MFEYMMMPYKKLYRLIEGRSSRSEYWWFTAFLIACYIAFFVLILGLGGLGQMADPRMAAGLMAGAGVASVILIIPIYIFFLLSGLASFAVTIRRLHDQNLSGWILVLYYVLFIPVTMIGGFMGSSMAFLIMLLYGVAWLVLMALPGTVGPNKYGEDPHGGQTAGDVFG